MTEKLPENESDLQNKIRVLETELFEKNQRVSFLEKELRIQKDQFQLSAQDVQKQNLENLITDLAPILVQWKTQQHLSSTQNSTLSAKDVLRVFVQLEKQLAQKGILFSGEIGSTTGYDPDQHFLLGSNQLILPEHPVTVKICGINFNNKMIRKIGVDAIFEE